MSNVHYNPGCALMLYKPDYADRVLEYLHNSGLPAEYATCKQHALCCRHDPQLPPGSLIINTCAGCDRRFRSLYDGISTISLWEIMADAGNFPFPDYQGAHITVHDPCPVRSKPAVHQAVRELLRKMNFELVEAEFNGKRSICCGDDLYTPDGKVPMDKIHAAMRRRAASMPCDDVCVYCVSCVKSMHIGGKRPRYLLDLLFNQTTDPQVYDTIAWHEALQAYIDKH